MSAKPLAELLDRLHAEGDVFVAEAASSVSVSNLSAAAAKSVFALVNELGWGATAVDSASTDWTAHDLPEDFAPFRMTFSKPEPGDGSLLILTNVGFASFLQGGHSASVWRIARLGSSLRTLGKIFLDWHAIETYSAAPATKNPRLLVRESTTPRTIPDDIRPWVLIDIDYAFDTQAARQWADGCILTGLRSLADEIDSSSGQLKFKGPPRLSLTAPEPGNDHYEELGVEAFKVFQQALAWVYENEREAEIRHILFASEIARSGGGQGSALERIRDDAFGALEGAKIAYQMSISELGKDTLKTLSDLRKAVTEDTAKVADSTRQTVTAVASALALGLGLVAARLATSTAPSLIFVVMIVVMLYVVAIIYSGYDFIRLQRQLRTDWQPRLYRFLPKSDYERMVSKPARHAEVTFIWSAIIGGVAVLSLTLVLGYSWLSSGEKANLPGISASSKGLSAANALPFSTAASNSSKDTTPSHGVGTKKKSHVAPLQDTSK